MSDVKIIRTEEKPKVKKTITQVTTVTETRVEPPKKKEASKVVIIKR